MKFITGAEARSQINKQIFMMFNISRLLNSPADNSLIKVQELIDQKYILEKRVAQLNQEVIKNIINEKEWISHKDYQFKTVLISQINKAQILELIQPLAKFQFVICYEQGGKFILASSDQILTEQIFGKLKKLGARGGGRDISIMGFMEKQHFSNIDRILYKIIEDLDT